MRSLISLFLIVGTIFGITFVDESQYSKEIVGNKNLKGAKFLGETIWQDEPINEQINLMDYQRAKEYCRNLKLLGIKGWRLPLKTDFMILDTDKNKLRYIARGCESFGFCSRNNEYYTQTPHGKSAVFIGDLDNGSVPHIRTTKYLKTKSAVRCVLNPNIYNRVQNKRAKKLEKQNSLDGYLEAFLATKKRSYLKKALALSKTKKDKVKVEAALFRFLGFMKLFDVVANGEIIGKKSDNFDTNSRLLAGMIKSKSMKYRFKIRPKKRSALKLKYNSYKVTLEFNLKIKYNFVSFGIGTTKRKFIHTKKTFLLSPKSRYTADIVVDFGKIEQSSKARFLIVSTSTTLKSIDLTFDVNDIKILEYK